MELPATLPHGLHVAAKDVEEGGLGRSVATLQEGADVPPVQGPVAGDVDAAPPGDRGIKVHGIDDLGDRLPGRDPSRPPDDARHPLTALPRCALGGPERTVAPAAVTNQGTVVTGEDDHRVLVQAQGSDLVKECPGRPINALHRRPVTAVSRLSDEAIPDVDRQVHVEVGEVEEERPAVVRGLGVTIEPLERLRGETVEAFNINEIRRHL